MHCCFDKRFSPKKSRAKMIVIDDSKIFGTIGGGALEKDVMKKQSNQLNLQKLN